MMIKLVNILIFISAIFIISCNSDNKKPSGEWETRNSGNLTVWCEYELKDLLNWPLDSYKKDYQQVKLTVNYGSSRETMAKLLTGKTRAIMISRGYLKDEDSLMKLYDVKPHKLIPMADDALVFFVNKDFPVDTLNADDIFNYLTDRKFSMAKKVSGLEFEPEIAVTNNYSSIYWNLVDLAARGKFIQRKMNQFATLDSVMNYVTNNSKSIGIAYLSHIFQNENFKALRIGYTDTAGYAISPKPVHQGWIIQGYYPYVVKLRIYLLEDRTNLPFWFAIYLGRETKIQRYFKDAGIIPAFAKIQLNVEDY